MNKISKAQQERLDELGARYTAKCDELRKAIEEANELIRKANTLVSPVRESFNELVEEATSLASEIADDLEGYASERSEKWAETENGQAFSEWIDKWRNEPLEEVEDLDVSEIDEPDLKENVFGEDDFPRERP